MIKLVFLTLFALQASTEAFINTEGAGSYLDPSQFQLFADQCKKNNVPLDEQAMEDVKICLKPVIDQVQGAEMQDRFGIMCDNAAKLRECYAPIFDLLEKCVPGWPANEKAFRPMEIFDNVVRAFCPKDLTERIKNVVVVKKAGRSALLCYMTHYQAIGQDALGCPVVLQLLMDPNNTLGGEKICGALDNLEKCLLQTLDLCGENKEAATKYATQVFDVFVGLVFKCEGHENF